MAFPTDLEIEIAFNNDINERDYAQTGWTSVLPFVASFSGDLRGRSNELSQPEAGSLSVVLDNSDGRFIPGSVASPYFPNVKPSRRFRVRGKNMVHPNVAQGGMRDHSLIGFQTSTPMGTVPTPAGATATAVLHDPLVLTQLPSDITYHAEITIPSGVVAGTYTLAAWYIPNEFGVRLCNSAYVWKISGTEEGTRITRLQTRYFDDSDTELLPNVAQVANPTGATPTVPTRLAYAHTPPPTTQYALGTLTVVIPSTTAGTTVYGISAVQSELAANLAPDISGKLTGAASDTMYMWQVEGGGTITNDQTSAGNEFVISTYTVNAVSTYITIPHLIPGETYTAAVEARIVSGQPNVIFTGDEGVTGSTISSTTFATYTATFEAEQAEQDLQWIIQGTPLASAGLHIRKLNVQLGTTSPGLAASSDTGVTTWARPKDIFEGWVESWPAPTGSNQMTVSVVDRMARIGKVDLANTLKEALLADKPELLMPMTDSMLDSPGRFSQLGVWGDVNGGPSYVDIDHTRGDLSTTSYTTNTDDGPTGEASLRLSNLQNAAAGSQRGYFFWVPYTKDYVYTTPTIPPITSKPPPKGAHVYTKKWYATWSRSFDSTNATLSGDPAYMTQGQNIVALGNTKSLAGFDYKNIRSSLIGATILECYVTFMNIDAALTKGLYVWVGTHNLTAKPSTWLPGNITAQRWRGWGGESRSVTLNMGITAGNQFKGATANGVSLGPVPVGFSTTDHYGQFCGATQSNKPYLTIKYWKK